MVEEIGVRREKHICEECLHWITEIRQKNLLEELRKWNPRLQGKWLWSVFLNDLCVSTITRDRSWRDLHLLQSSGFQTTPTLVRFPSPNIVNCDKTGFGTSSIFFVDFLSSLSLRLHNPRGHWFYFKEWWINVALQTCSNIRSIKLVQKEWPWRITRKENKRRKQWNVPKQERNGAGRRRMKKINENKNKIRTERARKSRVSYFKSTGFEQMR